MSEIVARESGALERPSEEFVDRFPALDDQGEDLVALLAENLGGDGDVALSIGDFIRVKVPAGGGTLWMVPDPDNGDEKAEKTITGVIVTRARRRSYWESEEVNGTPPDCRSNDLKLGEGMYGVGSEVNPAGTCSTCPMSQRGSMPGRSTQASACKQQELLFLLPPGELLPWMVSVPPGSLQGLRKFMLQQVSLRRLDYRQVEVTLSLAKVKKDGVPEFAQIVFAKGAKLGSAEHAAVKAFGEKLAKLIESQADVLADYADGVADSGGTVVDAEPVDYEPGSIPEDEVDLSGARAK